MSGNWRIKTNVIDMSATVSTDVPIIGATVISSPKGSSDFYYFGKGSAQQIIDTYGYPSSTYPSIQDAIDFNNKAGLFLSAPSKSGKYGGVFLTKVGTVPFVSGTSTKTITSYAEIPCNTAYGVGDGVKVTYTLTLPNFAYYVNQSIDILIDGASITIAATNVAVEVLTSTPSIGSGTYTRATGVLSFTFLAAPIVGKVITATYDIDLTDEIYATIYSHDTQADDLKVMTVADEVVDGNFYMSVYRYVPSQKDYFEINGSPFNFSLDPMGKDGNGSNIYIKNIFADEEQTIFSVTTQNEVVTTYVDDTVSKALVGGSRGTAVTDSDLAVKYSLLADKNKYPVKIIFDTTAGPLVATACETLRLGDLPRVRFELPTADLSATSLIATPEVAANATSDRGIYYYCLTWGIHKDIYQGLNFNCSNMGLIAGKMADVLILGPGGNPAWVDEGGVGGQLGSSIVKFNQKATDSQLQLLDKARLNPVVADPNYGNIIKSWRTRQTILSDYSYIPQSSLADWILDAIETQVLPLQLGKLIDDFHMGLVKSKCDSILGSVKPWLNDYYTLCDRSNNTANTMQQQKFILTVGVQFTPYSNTIEFNFINTPQGTSVEEVIKKK